MTQQTQQTQQTQDASQHAVDARTLVCDITIYDHCAEQFDRDLNNMLTHSRTCQNHIDLESKCATCPVVRSGRQSCLNSSDRYTSATFKAILVEALFYVNNVGFTKEYDAEYQAICERSTT